MATKVHKDGPNVILCESFPKWVVPEVTTDWTKVTCPKCKRLA